MKERYLEDILDQKPTNKRILEDGIIKATTYLDLTQPASHGTTRIIYTSKKEILQYTPKGTTIEFPSITETEGSLTEKLKKLPAELKESRKKKKVFNKGILSENALFLPYNKRSMDQFLRKIFGLYVTLYRETLVYYGGFGTFKLEDINTQKGKILGIRFKAEHRKFFNTQTDAYQR